MDCNGNVFVTGSSFDKVGLNGPFIYHYDYLTVAYSSSGALLWANTYDGPSDDDYEADQAIAIAVDTSGNVFVTGTSRGCADSATSDYVTIAYSNADRAGNRWREISQPLARFPFCEAGSRLVKPRESFRTQGGFQFPIGGPKPTVQMQRESDKGRVLQVHVTAKAAGFHPGADRDTAFFHELNPGEQFVKTFQKGFFAQVGRFDDAFLVFEQLDEQEARAVERVRGVGEKAAAAGASRRSSREKKTLVSTTSFVAFTQPPARGSEVRWPATSPI